MNICTILTRGSILILSCLALIPWHHFIICFDEPFQLFLSNLSVEIVAPTLHVIMRLSTTLTCHLDESPSHPHIQVACERLSDPGVAGQHATALWMLLAPLVTREDRVPLQVRDSACTDHDQTVASRSFIIALYIQHQRIHSDGSFNDIRQ